MGNSNQPIRQETYKICMQCNSYGSLNDELQILNIISQPSYQSSNGD